LRSIAFLLVAIFVVSALAVWSPSNAAGTSSPVPQAKVASPSPASINPFIPNFDIIDHSTPYAWQVEPTMQINKSGTVFVGWKETNGPDAAGYRVGASYSTDQGQTWAPNILMNQTHPNDNCRDSDPWMAMDPTDRLHFAYLEYDPNGGSSPPCNSGLDVSNTTTGNNWGSVHYIQGNGGLVDKDSIAFDSAGRLYATWDEGNVLSFTWSDDAGSHWAPIINPGGQSSVLGAIVATSANGTVYLTWWTFGPNNILFESSSDRGKTWSSIVRVNDRDGSASGGFPQYPLPAMNVDPKSGAIYVSWADSRNGNPDIYFANSTNGGKTWGTNHRINDNTDNSQQYMVDLAVDGAGTVHAAWEDRRTGNWNIFYSNSTDGGQTWSKNIRVTSAETPGSYDRPGDYFAIEAGPNNYIYVVWTDGRGTDFDIYYARSPGFPVATVTIDTSPARLPITVDGKTGNAPIENNWTIGSVHTIAAPSLVPINSTARYNWTSWSDNGTMSHSIVATGDMTIIASFTKQFQAGVALDPSGIGLVVLVDNQSYSAAASFWWDEHSTHWADAPSPQSISADVRYNWSSWNDGGDAAHQVTAAPGLTLKATFIEQDAMRISTSPDGLAFTLDGMSYSSATTFWLPPGSYHTVAVSTLQSGAPGVRYRFASWSDGGAASHIVILTPPMTLVATFSTEYNLTVTADSPVPGTSGSGWYAAGTTATASVAYSTWVTGVGQRLAFQGWGGSATGSGLTSDPILMNGPKTAVARYGTQYYLDVSSGPYATASGSGWYAAGSSATATVSATTQSLGPGARASFAGWAGDATGTGATSNPILMSGAKVATATWKTQYELTIVTTYGNATGQGWYDAGSTAVARLAAGVVPIAEGTRVAFAGWTGDAAGTDASGSNPILMSGPRTATAQWRTEYYLRVDSDIGAVQGSGWYAAQATVTVSAPGQMTSGGQTYQFAGWTGDKTSSDASITITMNGPTTIRATWASSPGTLGGISAPGWIVIGLVVVIAVGVGIVVRRRRGRKS
jgi:uncharacterized repeat protein (TIGR02543 family)